MGSTLSSASRLRIVDPVLFPVQASWRTSRQRIVFRLRFPLRLCALPGFLRFIIAPSG